MKHPDELPGPAAFIVRVPWFPNHRLEGRPIEQAPKDGHVGIMYRRNAEGFGQAGVGMFKDGAWTNGKGRPLGLEGLHWTAFVDD